MSAPSMFAGAPTALLPAAPFANLTVLNSAELQKRGLLTEAARFAVDGFLWDHPPNGGLLSERSYRFWSTAGSNAAAYYQERVSAVPIDPDAVDRIVLQLGLLQPADRRGLDYLATIVSRVITSGAMAAAGRPEVEVRSFPEVFPVQPLALWALCDPWHARLADYVIRQDRFEKSQTTGKATEQRRIQFLLQLYAWYVNLVDEVQLPLDRPTVYGILQRLFPAGWKRKSFEIASQYTRYLAQMIAIEEAIGVEAPRLTGYVQRGLPLRPMEKFLASAEAKDRWSKVSQTHLDPLREIFGRYFYLTAFSTRTDERRLRGVLRGAAHFSRLPEESLAGMRALFLGLQIYLAVHEGEWAVESPGPRQEKGPFWSYRTRKEQILAIGEAKTTQELEWIEEPHNPLADAVVGQRVTALLEQKLISQETLYAIHTFLHRHPPAGDILQESSYRFWLAFFANLVASYVSTFGTDGPLRIRAVAELTRRLIEDAIEEELPSLHYVLQGLREILKPPLAVAFFDLPQVSSHGLLPLEEIVSPQVLRLARYVVEQDGFESGTGFVASRVESVDLLVRLYDWYLSYVDEEAIDRNRIPLQHKLVHGIVRGLNPSVWGEKPHALATYTTRKLRQLLALSKCLPGHVLTGYRERAIPVPLINEFVSQGHAKKPDLPENPGTMSRLLANLFGRFYYLKNFRSPSADFTRPRSLQRLKKIIAGFVARGEVQADAVSSLEQVFLSFHQYLLRREDEWIAWSRLKEESVTLAEEDSKPPENFAHHPFAVLSATNIAWRGKALKAKKSKRHLPLQVVPTLSEIQDEGYFALLEAKFDAAWHAPLPEAVRKIPVDAAGYREYLARAASGEAAKVGEPPPTPASTQRAIFQLPGWLPKGWTEGRGGILNRNTLMEAGLLTRRVADLCYNLLTERNVPPSRLGGVFSVIVNIYSAYRALGGGIGRVNLPLLEKVATGFARHGKNPSKDYRAHAGKRTQDVLGLIETITATNAREGFDISLPPPSFFGEKIPLLKLSKEEEAVLEAPPEGWIEGKWGLLSVEALMRLALIVPKMVSYCGKQVERSGMASSEKREGCLVILCNILAAHATTYGWSPPADRSSLNERAKQFVVRAAQSVPSLFLEDFQEWSRLALDWRKEKSGALYPRLEEADLREKLGDVFPLAEGVLAEETGLSPMKREKMKRTLLNIFYYYGEGGGSLKTVDIPLANSLIAELVSRNDWELIHRYRRRLQNLLEQFHRKQMVAFLASLQTSGQVFVETWASESGENLEIPGLSPPAAKALAEWGLAEIASDTMIGMIPDPSAHLWDLILKWQNEGFFPEESARPLYKKILEIRDWHHERQLIPSWALPTLLKEFPKTWLRGETTIDLKLLREGGFLSIPAQMEVIRLMEEQEVPQERRRTRLHLLCNIVAVYFARGGTLWWFEKSLLDELTQAFAKKSKVPDPEGFARYLKKSTRVLLERLRTVTPQQQRAATVKWEGVALLRDRVSQTPVQEPPPLEARPVAPPPSPRHKAQVSGAIPIADPTVLDRPTGATLEDWLRRESFLPPQQLVAAGLLSPEVAKLCDNFLAQRRKTLGRGERITHQFILYNLLAAYALETKANTRQMDPSILERVLNDFAGHGGVGNLSEKRGYYFETLKELFDYFRAAKV